MLLYVAIKNLASAHHWAQVSVVLLFEECVVLGVWVRVARCFPILKLFAWKGAQVTEPLVLPSQFWGCELKGLTSEKWRHSAPAPLFQQELSMAEDRSRLVAELVFQYPMLGTELCLGYLVLDLQLWEGQYLYP